MIDDVIAAVLVVGTGMLYAMFFLVWVTGVWV